MTITQFAQDIYILDDQRVREFLILGRDHAVLIDTGFSDTPILDEVRKITALPVQVILTHGDGDHIGNLSQFKECCFHQADEAKINPTIPFHSLKEGDIIDIGDYHFKIIEIPGHTYGSIALLELQHHWLIVGDTVQKDGPIYMFGEHRNLDQYIESLKKLANMKEQIRTILPSHHDCPISPDYIDYCLEDAKRLKDGQLESSPHPKMPCREYRGVHVHFYY
ncbi:MBL fold metallo-hydrolase [Beduini massiliensis]|uniref:MBL fold metallo-hydrolase n=1 Tax=Beduini massiliensis TaxID=1585974 RepID=UPI00059A8F64|nr:MBL fold metallo-hydrolase [Beduini massiliensis]